MLSNPAAGADPTSNIWVGGYTEDMGGMAEGILLLKKQADGSLHSAGLAAGIPSPSYLTRAGDVLYTTDEGVPSVSAFHIVGDELRFLGLQDAAGESPCSVLVTADRRFLIASCYGNGAVDVHPLDEHGVPAKTSQWLRGEGRGPNENQEGPHAHDVLQADATTILTTDLGTDSVHIHRLDADGLVRTGSVALPPGTGPRDLYQANADTIYVLGELSGVVVVLGRAVDSFDVLSVVALPGAEQGDHAASLAVSTDGQYLYSGLRGSNRIAVLRITDGGRTLEPVASVDCGGGWPRHLIVDGDYLRVANQLTNTVDTFTIGADGVPEPHSSLFVPSPTYLLVG